MAANADDHAVVIGISRYADVGADPPWITNLNGPDNDALAVATWLKKDDGGGLPDGNVRMVRSADFPDPTNVGPQQKAVNDEFTELQNLPTTTYNHQFTGRRLYVYVSGHGLASTLHEAAVITAEAKRADPLHVLVTSWFDWFWYAARFTEYVLWVDTCASRVPAGLLKPAPGPWRFGQDAGQAPRVVAFAAEFGKKAVENPIDGEWHGVFTYVLLQALGGAGGTPVTTSSLQNYLHNSMTDLMTQTQLDDSGISRDAYFDSAAELEFAAPKLPEFPVRLQFEAEAVGKRVTISFDASKVVFDDTVPAEKELSVSLPAGFYVACLPELGRAQPFTVTGGGSDGVVAVH